SFRVDPGPPAMEAAIVQDARPVRLLRLVGHGDVVLIWRPDGVLRPFTIEGRDVSPGPWSDPIKDVAVDAHGTKVAVIDAGGRLEIYAMTGPTPAPLTSQPGPFLRVFVNDGGTAITATTAEDTRIFRLGAATTLQV